MKAIITGGTGFVGRALAADLISSGWEVVVLSRSPQKAVTSRTGVGVERWDGVTGTDWSHLIDSNTAIVNLAGAGIADSPWSDERKRTIVESRENAGHSVVRALEAASARPRVVVQASAVGYYGIRPVGEIIEDSPPGRGFLTETCVRWEASTAAVEGMGVRRVVIRGGLVLSAGGGAMPRMMLPFRMFVGGPLGSGRQPFPWIHLADEVGAIRFLIDDETASGAFNLTAPQKLTNARFSRALGKAMNRPALIPVPGFALRLIFGELASMLLDGQMVLPGRLLNLGYRFRFGEIAAALLEELPR